MTTAQCIAQAKAGYPVYIHQVSHVFEALPESSILYWQLEMLDNDIREFAIPIPKTDISTCEDEKQFIRQYVYARVYNILSAVGGRSITCYYDPVNIAAQEVLDHFAQVFELEKEKKARVSYGKAINVIERMLQAFGEEEGRTSCFTFTYRPISERKPIVHAQDQCGLPTETNGISQLVELFRNATVVGDHILCGIDVGGTDIKIAASNGGRKLYVKEYDWYPSSFQYSEQLIHPIILLIRLMLAILSWDTIPEKEKYGDTDRLLQRAMERNASDTMILHALDAFEQMVEPANYLSFDAIGLCFPDVVVRNKIIGGETYKTRGIRNNRKIDYEEEFRKLTALHKRLEQYCRKEKAVHIINDGPMAAFAAAVELSFSPDFELIKNGVFAHTLGTELGTGWIDEQGRIPEIPLELYNFIIDLGSWPDREYNPDDLRSINNFNTGIPGTIQKYASQSGIFRLAIQYSQKKESNIYRELLRKNLIIETEKGEILVPTSPVDMRKPLLEYITRLTVEDRYPFCEEIFRKIGEYLAVIWIETKQILAPKTNSLLLFGRLVTRKECFELMRQGAKRITTELELYAADNSLANSPLMKQLQQDRCYTVAQFAQAVGAVYFGNYCLKATSM